VASVNSRKRVRTPSTSEAGPASVVRPRISRSPQLLLLGTTGSPTHDDGGTELNTQPFPASSVIIEHLTPPEQARLWKSKPLVDSLRTKSDLTVDTDQATLSLSGSNITGSPLMTNENATDIEDGEVLFPVSSQCISPANRTEGDMLCSSFRARNARHCNPTRLGFGGYNNH